MGFAQRAALPFLKGGRSFDSGSRYSQGNAGFNSSSSSYPVVEDRSNVYKNLSVSVVEPTSPETFDSSRQNAPSVSNRRGNMDAARQGNRNSARGVASSGFPSGTSSDTKSVNPIASTETSKRYGVLQKTNGQYDFIRIVSADEVDRLETPLNETLIVVPRKNFLVDVQSEDEKFVGEKNVDDVNDKELERSNKSVGPFNKTVALENTDEYVVFTLKNLDADEQLLLRDSRNGVWDFADLLSASLIAEGLTTRESRAPYRAKFETLLASLKPQTVNLNDQLMKTQRVYDFVHTNVLYSKYNLNCSSVAASLNFGVFNCVSATVLFNCFASRVGLNVAALETTGHAKSRVKYDNCFLDIETTCFSWDRLPDRVRPYANAVETELPGGLQGTVASSEGSIVAQSTDAPGDALSSSLTGTATPADVSSEKKRVVTGKASFRPVVFDDEQKASLMSVSSSNSVEKGKEPEVNLNERSRLSGIEDGSTMFGIDEETPVGYSFTRTPRPMYEITDVELVATIYYNVGVDRYQAGDYYGAIVSYIKALQLAPNNLTMLGNLKATLNNWAIDFAAKSKDYENAIRITELGMLLDPDFHEFKTNIPIFFRDWIEYLAKDNKWDEVRRVQEKYRELFPEE